MESKKKYVPKEKRPPTTLSWEQYEALVDVKEEVKRWDNSDDEKKE